MWQFLNTLMHEIQSVNCLGRYDIFYFMDMLLAAFWMTAKDKLSLISSLLINVHYNAHCLRSQWSNNWILQALLCEAIQFPKSKESGNKLLKYLHYPKSYEQSLCPVKSVTFSIFDWINEFWLFQWKIHFMYCVVPPLTSKNNVIKSL